MYAPLQCFAKVNLNQKQTHVEVVADHSESALCTKIVHRPEHKCLQEGLDLKFRLLY